MGITHRRSLSALLLALGLGDAARAQTAATERSASAWRLVMAVADHALGVGEDSLPVVEPHLAVDPRSAAHLVAGAAVIERPELLTRESQRGVTRSRCVALASFDGGARWARHVFPVPDCLDAWVAVHPDGTAFFAMISTLGSRLLVYRSSDGGRTWGSPPADLGPGHDHPTLAVDTTTGAGRGALYVVSRQAVRRRDGRTRDHLFVARSRDAGRSFDIARSVPLGLAMNTMSAAVLSDGALVVPLGTFGPPLGDVEWFVRSDDGGRSFTEPVPAPRGCARSFPHLTADGSRGASRDALYLVCNDSAYARILLLRSTDRGESWSAPVVVSGAEPARDAASVPYVRNAVAAVNLAGVVGVSWYDGRGDTDLARGQDRCQVVYFAASVDGGLTFLPPIRISSADNCPTAPGNGGAGARWRAGGDYHGLVALPDGSFRILWADSRSGRYQLRTAVVRLDGPTRPGPSSRSSRGQTR